MNHMNWFVGAMALSLIAGCASLRTSTSNPNDQIDSWLHQQEYGKAVAYVADLKASSPPATRNLREIEERIHTHISSYEQQVVAKAEKASAMNDWGTAFDVYREALTRLPESTLLQQGQRQLLQRHAEHLERLELERLIAKGEWTLKDLEISKVTEANKSGDWFGQFSLNRKLAAANALALELAEHGKRALERKDLTMAQRILPLAKNLSNAVESAASNAKLQHTLQGEGLRIPDTQQRSAEAQSGAQRTRSEQQNTKERSAGNGQDPKKAKRLMADFRKACHEKNLLEAQQLRSQLEKRGVDNREFEKLRRQLASDVARHVKHLIEVGATHYSRQQYQEAMDVWQQAQVLDPKNEQLAARIKRVTRVLEKLQTLREKSAATQ